MTRLITKQMRDSFNLKSPFHGCKLISLNSNAKKKQRILILKGTIK